MRSRRPVPDWLVEVAVALFNERGYDGTTMDAVAARLCMSKSSIYHHVSGKEELLELAVSRAFEAVAAVLDEDAASGHDTARLRLERTLRRSVEVLATELPYVAVLMRVRGNSAVELRVLECRREVGRRFAELVLRAAAEGGLREDVDPRVAARLVSGTISSLIEWYDSEGGPPPPTLAHAVAAVLLDGLRLP